MKEGEIILTPIPQADGTVKNRPALLLREMPCFRDFLFVASAHNFIVAWMDLTKQFLQRMTILHRAD